MLRHAASRVGIRIGNLYALYRPAAIGRMVERSISSEYIFQGRMRVRGVQYTVADVALLAETDALYDTLSGPATQNLLQRALLVFGDTRTARLASISVAHLYHLRGAARLPGAPPTGDQDAPHRHRSRSAVGDRGHLASGSPRLPAAGDQGHARRLPLHDQRLPCRQRLRSTSTTRSPAGWRSSASSSLSGAIKRQRPGRDQERRRAAQVLRRQPSPQRYAMQINAFCAAYLNPSFHRPCLFAEDTIDRRQG